MLKNGMMKLSDDMLEEVTGGAMTARHTDGQLEQAGVIIGKDAKGNRTYSILMNNGKNKISINENVAMGICDCYINGGNSRMTDGQIRDLIAQS